MKVHAILEESVIIVQESKFVFYNAADEVYILVYLPNLSRKRQSNFLFEQKKQDT